MSGGVKLERVSVGEVTLNVATQGEGPPVVLLHGWALAQHTYRNVIEEIAEQGCRVIAPAMFDSASTRSRSRGRDENRCCSSQSPHA